MTKKAALPSMRLKKFKEPKEAPKRPLIYMMAKGTPNEMGPPKGYPEEKYAKGWANKFLASYIPWCKRFNPAGVKAIERAMLDIDGLPVFLESKRRITCVLDEHTGMTLCVEMWKEKE